MGSKRGQLRVAEDTGTRRTCSVGPVLLTKVLEDLEDASVELCETPEAARKRTSSSAASPFAETIFSFLTAEMVTTGCGGTEVDGKVRTQPGEANWRREKVKRTRLFEFCAPDPRLRRRSTCQRLLLSRTAVPYS